jgi:hypothetical protein
MGDLQPSLFGTDRVYESERAAWDITEAYYSRPEYVRPLVTYFDTLCDFVSDDTWDAINTALHGRIVEPCVGGGALVDGLARYWNRVDTNVLTGDIRAVGADWTGDWTADPSTWTWNRDVQRYLAKAGIVVSNPPFEPAIDIVEASWRHCPDAIVAILQRATWYEPTIERAPWLMAHNPDQITIGRCEFFRPDGTSAGKGDTCSYTWYVFGPNKTGPRGGHHCIIPWKETAHAPVR